MHPVRRDVQGTLRRILSVMRGVAALVLGIAVLGLGTTGTAATSSSTSLKVTYWPRGPEASESRVWTLRCAPAGGTLQRPELACRRLAAVGKKLFAPVPRDAVCTQIYGGPAVARVAGTVGGERVWARFSLVNGCHIDRWTRLAPWLLPRVRTYG
jgi:Subtilisin inhibitor-like